MAAAWRTGSLLRGRWFGRAIAGPGTGSCHALPSRGRLATSMPALADRSIHCNRGSRPALRAQEPPGGPESRLPEYIPQRRAKNPMGKIGLAWLFGLPSGVISFLLVKREVDKNRLKQVQARRRMKVANEGEYRSERYRQHSATSSTG
ncbi:probable hydrolase PNKD [Amblyraja radiata]|uniref:probable hydrolase PNKD n=1 Tax=Amblyraja radiata TaxID=386614 RepID=UPI0014027717|nr:probable hydrolase PNKD [Amblyraja radiata]